MTAMTAPQGRFLSSLLDDLTAAAPRAGVEARTRLRAQFAAGRLDKAEASRAITVLKQAIDLAKGHRVPATIRPTRVEQPALTVRSGALDLEREALALEARRAQAATLRKGKPATKRSGSVRRGPSVMEALRSWTPERAAEANAAFARGEVPF